MNALRRALLGPLAAAALAVPSLCANDVVFVADTSGDTIYRLEDLDLDGTFDGAGEVTVFYDDATGALPLSSPNCVALAPDGTVFVAESGSKSILALQDLNQDGDSLDTGEAWVFFDGNPGGNPGGIHMVSPNGLTLDDQGRVWVASSNLFLSGTIVGDDMILLLEDGDSDGNANGVGEATIFHSPALGSGGVGDSIPTAVKVGQDGAVYYADNGVTGVVTKAVWRLEDLDSSGTIDQPGEATDFFPIPTAGSTYIWLWDVEQGADGAWYASDRNVDVLWRAFDANGDKLISTGEYTAWFTNPSSGDLWTVRCASDGSIYGGDASAPSRIRRFSDDDASGVIDAGEVTDLYDNSIAVEYLSNPRCIALQYVQQPPGTPYCFGDGSGTPCPCGNANDGSVPESGCANGVFASGAHLTGTGVASVGADTLVLSTSGQEPNNSGLYFQANNDLTPGLIWGDGLQCAGGQLKRLGVRFADAGGYSDTSGYTQPISVKAGNVMAGDTKYYQCWYRNPVNSPCASEFNASNGYAVTWTP